LGIHHHAEARIVFSLHCSFETRFASMCVTVNDSAALFRPVGEEHQDRYHAPTTTLSLLLPADGPLAQLREPFVVGDSEFTSLVDALRSEMGLSDTAAPLVMEGLALLATSRVLHRRPLREKGVPRWIGTVRARIETEYVKPPTLAELGHMVDRDAAYVAATFKRVYGNSVGGYVRRLRLWEARRCLDAEPESSLSDVAQRCGFGDQSHFTRQFRRLFALTPSAYRRHQGARQEFGARRQMP
jgi:AraC family transcriptional regulator